MGGSMFALALIVLVAAGYIVQAINRASDARQLPPAEPEPDPYFEGDCHVCGTRWQVALRDAGRFTSCVNCNLDSIRQRGGFPEWRNLPPGAIVGICRSCIAKTIVMRTDGGAWLCQRCYDEAPA